jgi:hypothetical protein
MNTCTISERVVVRRREVAMIISVGIGLSALVTRLMDRGQLFAFNSDHVPLAPGRMNGYHQTNRRNP